MSLPAERIAQIERRHAALAHDMGNPALPPEQFVALSKDYAELTPLVEAAQAATRAEAALRPAPTAFAFCTTAALRSIARAAPRVA
ncbi:hypothetical protein [Sandarakinorhabdus sp.]|uniref:hypothetical protein n=1 Tax=Sandarakinorhabdus sp. TaxID=1916663 RepID=UPI0028A7FDE3|nr:hypothetical protein [Sandarakinorhabdus sp.]